MMIIKLSRSPRLSSIGPDFVVNTPSDTVDVIDATSLAIITPVNVGIDPVGIAVRPNGKEVWVTNPPYAPYLNGRPSEAGKPTSLNLGICKQSRKIEQAVDFLMFLSSNSSMERWIVDGDRIAPVRNIEPNPLVKAFAPHEEGHLRGFRVDFLNYGIDLTRSAFKSSLHLLINPKG